MTAGRIAVSQRVVAVVTVYDTPELLPHFLQHYSRLGVDQILVALAIDLPNQSSFEQHFPVRFTRFYYDGFTNARKSTGENYMLAEAEIPPDAWVMHLDLDEFHEYPAALQDVVQLLNAHGRDAVTGQLYDRVSADGVLKPIETSPSIEEQYPLGGSLAGPLLGGCTTKIMLARRRVALGSGRHGTMDGTPADHFPVGRPADYRVHHFRWVKGLTERIEQRFLHPEEQYDSDYPLRNLRLAQQVRDRGHIDLNDRSLNVHTAVPIRYPAASDLLRRAASVPRNGWQVDDADITVLSRLARTVHAKRVLEFGPGRSTWLWATLGCEVDSLEYDASHFERQQQEFAGVPEVRIHSHGRPISVDLPFSCYDLSFVDGPPGALYESHSRIDAVRFALGRCSLVAMHDCKRRGERQTLEALRASGYLAQIFDTPRGIAVFRLASAFLREVVPGFDARDADRMKNLVGKRFRYIRVGYDERPLSLAAAGTITEGAARCETYWCCRNDHLLLLDSSGAITCALEYDNAGVWHGRWASYERMPVRLELL